MRAAMCFLMALFLLKLSSVWYAGAKVDIILRLLMTRTMKKIGITLAALTFPVFVFAGFAKYTFNDVVIDGFGIIEIEAAIKDAKKNTYSRCDYYSDNYMEWLGSYEAFGSVSGADSVKTFCVDNFGNRVQ